MMKKQCSHGSAASIHSRLERDAYIHAGSPINARRTSRARLHGQMHDGFPLINQDPPLPHCPFGKISIQSICNALGCIKWRASLYWIHLGETGMIRTIRSGSENLIISVICTHRTLRKGSSIFARIHGCIAPGEESRCMKRDTHVK